MHPRILRSRRFALVVLASFVPLAMAGCSDDGTRDASLEDPWSGAPDLEWGVLDANTTAFEPWEEQGDIFVAWTEGTFAIHASLEEDLPAYLVRTSDTVFTSHFGMGWLRLSIEEAVDGGAVSNRLVLWDLRGILGHEGLKHSEKETADGTVLSATGSMRYRGGTLPVEARVTVTSGRILHATVASDAGRESPFTFTRPEAGQRVPDFPTEAPDAARAKGAKEVDEKDAVAQSYHGRIIRLINAYVRNHGGILPERVTAEELRAELLVEGGGAWPTSVYDGEPIGNQEASGHFSWQRCTLNNGRYVGYGWDGLVVEQAYGAGC